MKFKSINTRMVFMITVMALVLTIVLVFSTGILSFNVVKDAVNDGNIKNVESYSNVVGNWANSKVNEAKFYANNPIIKTMNFDDINNYIDSEMQKVQKQYYFVGIADKEGNYRTNVPGESGNISKNEGFKNALLGRDSISSLIISSATGKEIVMVMTPIYNDDEIVGTFIMGLDLIRIQEFIDRFKSYTDKGYLYIVDKNGVVISHPNKDILGKERITEESIYVSKGLKDSAYNILTSNLGEIEYKENNKDKMVYFHTIPNSDGWKLVMVIPKNYVMESMRYIECRLSIIAILMVILSIIVARFLADTIASPVIDLTKIFNRAAEGDLTVVANESGNDEISAAAKNFNIMIKTIRNMIYLDPLTGVFNRETFIDKLGVQIRCCKIEKQQLAVFVVSVDRFKKINDAHGHRIGDEVIRHLSDRLKVHLDEKSILSRMNGDEFLILSPRVQSQTEALNLGNRLLEIIKEPFDIEDKEFHITASIGIAMYPSDGEDENILIKNVGLAKSKAKDLGGDRIKLYDSEMDVILKEQLVLDNMLHKAIQKNEFIIHYQPFISLETGKIEAAEALIRWNSSLLGMVSPVKFIPRAEENGLIIHIGKWVLKEACRQNKEWQDKGLKPICISVNVSAKQFEQEDFVDMVEEVIKETGLNPKYLELEITEGVAMQNVEDKIGKLLRLKELGVKISIDDFGTGYSSLSYLKRFPIDNLKIDRSFVRDVTSNENSKAIVSTIVSMGNNLKLGLIAEGVESEDQLEFIKSQNCDKVQGYLFSKPLDNTTFTDILEKDKSFC